MPKTNISVIIGSTNPVKVDAAHEAMTILFPQANIQCHAINAPSQVSDQPMTEAETRQGAINRLKHCQTQQQADFYCAMEGGVDNFDTGPATFAYIAVANQKQLSVGRSANLPLPAEVYTALKQGEELGNVMDRLFNTHNIKQAGGAIGLLTNGKATRKSIYTQAIILAMAPLLHPKLYQ